MISIGGWGLKDLVSFGHALVENPLWVFLLGDSLWRKISIAKYIEPRTILDWICYQRKLVTNVSSQWRVIINTFPMINKFLAWKFVLVFQVGIGVDLIDLFF
jgi:hypothetical protein